MISDGHDIAVLSENSSIRCYSYRKCSVTLLNTEFLIKWIFHVKLRYSLR